MSGHPPLYSAEQVEEMKRYNAGLTPAGYKTRSHGARGATRGVSRGLGSGIAPSTNLSYSRGGYGSGAVPSRSTPQPTISFSGAPARSAVVTKNLGGYNTVATSARPSIQTFAGFEGKSDPLKNKIFYFRLSSFLIHYLTLRETMCRR